MKTLCNDTAEIRDYPALKTDAETDVLIVGAGMTGVLCAERFLGEGLRVIVADSGRVAGGVTAGTTGKITSQHGLCYKKLHDTHGADAAYDYYRAGQRAVGEFQNLVAKYGIDCGFESCGANVYAQNRTEEELLSQEYDIIKKIGCTAELGVSAELPIKDARVLRFPGQARFHPLKFMAGLLREIDGRALFFGDTKCVGYSDHAAEFESGVKVRAKHIVIATHYPILNRYGLYFTKLVQEKSLLLAGKSPVALHDMYISCRSGHTMRSEGEYLLFGGEGHRTGGQTHYDRYRQLEGEAARLFPGFRCEYEWSAQDCMPCDGLPYIGRYSSMAANLYVATGYGKWGMTHSMTAAELLCDLITGKKNGFERLYNPQRLTAPGAWGKRLGYAASSTVSLIKGNVANSAREYAEPEAGQGGVFKYKGKTVGVYKDSDGTLHAFDMRCPHMRCLLAWNAEEKAYECPCHGSKFDYKGRLIFGPSKKSLTPVEMCL